MCCLNALEKYVSNPLRRKKDNSVGNRPARRSRFQIPFGPVLLVVSGMLLMAIVQTVILKPLRAGNGRAAAAATDRIADHSEAAWGNLEYTPLALDRPAEYFTNDVPQEITRWTVRGSSLDPAREFFASLEVGSEAHEFLTNAVNWEKVDGGFRVTPPPSVVVGIGSPAREKLYAFLAQFPENIPQRTPFQFRANGFQQWFDDCGLTGTKVDLVRRLTYQRNGVLCFSDAAAFSQVSTTVETSCLIKALWRVSTFIMAVRVTPGADVEQLVSYWGRAGRAQEYRPMLEALSRIDAGISVPVTYFMPGFARMRLYTYPRPSDARAIREDCFWTAMNFFNEMPDDRFFNPTETRRVLQQDYLRVEGRQKQFGDNVLLVNSEGKALHMAVYVADDVVFTKNGFDMTQPWILMRMDEMLASYENERPFEVRFHRRKTTPEKPAGSELSVN